MSEWVQCKSPLFPRGAANIGSVKIPERVANARGAAAFGTFVSYDDWSNLTAASFLNTKGKTTPVFVRFSTTIGSRGSADTTRDTHGFATRFVSIRTDILMLLY
jgi:catalase